MAESAASESLAYLTETWLSEGQGPPAARLPPTLLSLFELEKGRTRRRMDVSLCAAVIAIAGIAYALLRTHWAALSVMLDVLFVGVLAPVLTVSMVIVAGKPKPVWRELALAAPGLAALMVVTYLFIQGGRDGDGRALFVAVALMLMLFTMVSVHLRFDLAVGWMAAAQMLFAFGIAFAPAGGVTFRFELVAISLICGGYMLFVNYRMHSEQRRGFMFSLLEQSRRDALAAQNRALDDLARHDALTGLANRRAYDSWLRSLWAQVASNGRGVAGLIMLDVDHFKSYNDFYGHPAGDACLVSVGACLREQLRGTSDQVARIGGEEFAVVLPGVGLAHCSDIAERLRLAIAAMELPHLGRGTGGVLTISCGCASIEMLGAEPQDLCEAADAALYQAKQSGRNRVCLAQSPPRQTEGGMKPAHFASN